MDRTLGASILAMVVWACSSQSASILPQPTPLNVSDGYLLAQDLEPSQGVVWLDKEQMDAALGKTSRFHDQPTMHKVSQWDVTSGDVRLNEDCVFEHMSHVFIQAEDNILRATGALELSDCAEPTIGTNHSKQIDYQHTVRIFVEFTCHDTDLSRYDGLTLGEFRKLNDYPCRIAGDGMARHQLEHEILSRKAYPVDGRGVFSEVDGNSG